MQKRIKKNMCMGFLVVAVVLILSTSASALTWENVSQVYYSFTPIKLSSALDQHNSSEWWFTYNQTELTDGTYTYYGWSNDSAGNSNSTGVRTLTVDTTNPTVSITAPTSNQNLSSRTITITGTSADTNYNYTNITVCNSTGIVNSTINYSTSWSNALGVQQDGNYSVNATAWDNASNSKHTQVNVTVDTIKPSIAITTPVNTTHYNLNITINATVTDLTTEVNYVYYNITNSSGDLVNSSSLTRFGSTDYYNLSWDTTTVDDGNYSIVFWANDTVGNSNTSLTYEFTVDNTDPIWFIQDYPKATNNTAVNQHITLDPYVTDLYLWKILRNITNSSGQEMYSNLTTLTDGSTRYNVTDWINTSTWNNGVYNITLTACDSHTKKEIKNYSHKKLTNGFWFETAEGMQINITAETPPPAQIDDFVTNKKGDRYTIEFVPHHVLNHRYLFTFYIESNHPIYHIENSEFNGHFVTGLNWIDFENSDSEAVYYTPAKISETLYSISIYTNNLNFSSLGGLNEVTETYQFHVYSGCGHINVSDTTLTLETNLTSNGTCFTLLANNFTLDCNGHSLTGNNTGVGINSTNRDHITVSNCTIDKFNYNILFYNSTNTTMSKKKLFDFHAYNSSPVAIDIPESNCRYGFRDARIKDASWSTCNFNLTLAPSRVVHVESYEALGIPPTIIIMFGAGGIGFVIYMWRRRRR